MSLCDTPVALQERQFIIVDMSDKKDFSRLPDLLGVSQAAKAIGVKRDALYKAIERGRLNTVQVGPYRVIPKAGLERYVAHKKKPGRPRKI